MPRTEIMAAACVKLVATPLIVWSAAIIFFPRMGEAQYASVIEASTPGFGTLRK